VGGVIKQIVEHFNWKGPIGVGYPGVVQNGIARTAANVDDSWINQNLNNKFSKLTGCPVHVVNDADAAGTGEMKFGAGKNVKGVAMLITVGTGLGTVMFSGGKLVPNLELGHVILRGDDAEKYASDAARKNEDLSWEEWALRFNEYLERLEDLTWPDLIIIGGGASKKDDKFFQYLKSRAKVVPAQLLNEAGIIGAAVAARNQHKLQLSQEKK
jgi:polyphosphate glucokinase